MANGIVGDEWKLDTENPYETKPYAGAQIPPGRVSAFEASRLESTPLMATGAVLDMPQYQSIATRASQDTSDKIIQDWLNGFGVISKERQSPVEPLTPPAAPAAPAAPAPAPSVVNAAPSPVDNYIDRMSRAWEESGSVPLMQSNGSITFQARNQGNAEAEALQLRKDMGLAPKVGMEEYEANAAQMRADARLQGIVSGLPKKTRGGVIEAAMRGRNATEVAGIQGATENVKANTAYQAKIYESAIKSNQDWAKLGIQAQDVQSKMKYRQSQVDDLMTRSGLIEPMKLQLAQAKTSTDQTKIKRDFAMKALDKLHEDQVNEYRDTTMKMGGTTPKQQQEFNQILANYQTGVDNIMSMYPLEGDVRKLGDRIAKFVNGKYVDITDQVNGGVVGGK